MVPLRLLSYNIRSMRDDSDALVRVITGCRPDVVCLQEVPRFLRWRAKRRWLAERCGLTLVAGRRAAGLAVLAGDRVRVLHDEHHLLNRVPRLHRRGIAVGVLEVDGAPLIAASTHLDLRERPRRIHAAQLLGLLGRVRAAHEAPVVLAGDVNEEPGGPAWDLLTRTLRDAYTLSPAGEACTSPAAAPRRRIDAVFTDPVITVVACGVPGDPVLAADYLLATDHRPVLAELALAG